MKNILYIVPSDYESLKKKGVINLILERDEGSFFDRVLTLHPFTKYNKVVSLEKKNKLIEYGWRSDFDFLNRFLITKLFGTLIILFKLAFLFPIVIRREKISIIRATDPYYMGLIGLYYSKILQVPLVVSIHSDYNKRYELDKNGSFTILNSRYIAKKLESFIYRYCDLIIPIRQHMKEDIIKEYNVPENKIKIFPHGIDLSKISNVPNIDICKKFNLDCNKKLISFVGRVTKENYIDDIIEIAIKLKNTRNDFIFLMVGGGKDFDYLKHIIKKHDLDDVIKLTDFQEYDIVINVRKQSTISLCLMGGFSLIEACACERPIISYDVEWHHELVISEHTGFLIKEHHIDEVVSKIIFLLDNPVLSNEYGLNAKNLAFKAHDLINTTQIKKKIYTEVLNG